MFGYEDKVTTILGVGSLTNAKLSIIVPAKTDSDIVFCLLSLS